MSTLERLQRTGEIERIEPPGLLTVQDQRLIYGLRSFIEWKDTALKSLDPSWTSDMPPYHQVADAFREFAIGDDLAELGMFGFLWPRDGNHGVWEMRTTDVRIFGWFWRRDVFVCAIGGHAGEIKAGQQYQPLKRETMRLREALGFGPGDFVASGRLEDVVSL